jgi:hypothetical protein
MLGNIESGQAKCASVGCASTALSRRAWCPHPAGPFSSVHVLLRPGWAWAPESCSVLAAIRRVTGGYRERHRTGLRLASCWAARAGD